MSRRNEKEFGAAKSGKLNMYMACMKTCMGMDTQATMHEAGNLIEVHECEVTHARNIII